MSTTIAPRIEIYTMLACDAHKPEYTAGRGTEGLGIHPPWWSKDDIVQISASTAVSANSLNEQALSISMSNDTIPPSPQLCRSDPVVQAAVARLTTSACFTTSQPHSLIVMQR